MPHPNHPTVTTPERLAEHPDVIAVFVMIESRITDHDNLVYSAHGRTENVWRDAATSFARAASAALVDDHATMCCGDAQVLRYQRAGDHALVVVLTPGAALGKSIRRSMRVALKQVAKAAKKSEAA